ncbi:MAG: NifU family protein [Gammaproteobacteria bacterium]|nr:NifU family protein [Gammaproteobacteria bacterium]
MLTITEAAQGHFKRMLEKQELDSFNLRMSVNNPHTRRVTYNLTLCLPDEQKADDLSIDCDSFIMFVDAESAGHLDEVTIDYTETEDGGGKLDIQDPHMEVKELGEDATLAERVEYLVDTQVNAMVAGHGGEVLLEDVSDDGIVKLSFGGGCQGCGSAEVTLQDGIKQLLLDRIPEIKDVIDVTDHDAGENPYA